ncbi:class I SAM-dependent methyltransferase [Desulfomarina sp.]
MSHPIVYEDKDWLVVQKPVGIGTHGNRKGDTGLAEWLALHTGRRLYICSRLDKGTSGLLLFARNQEACNLAGQIHEDLRAEKKYYFLSDAKYAKATDWEVDTVLDGKKSLTRFRLVEGNNGFFLYEARIGRGRTHQVRRHASLCSIPVLGDDLYGTTSFGRLCLHCGELQWPGIAKVLVSPLPDSFLFLLAGRKDELVLHGAVAWERRMGWPSIIGNCFRLVHRGEAVLPVSIDFYDSFLSITAYGDSDENHRLQKKLQSLFDYFSGKIPVKGGVIRYHVKNPHRNKLIHKFLEWGEVPAEEFTVREHDLSYAVTLKTSRHIGLFLDQRDSRRRIEAIARNRRVANLFAFTCSFSAVAVAAEAEVVFSVDLAASALARGKENFALNELDKNGRGKFIREDVMKWLARQERKLQNNPKEFPFWDLIICDPPVYASAGRGRDFHVERKWPELVRQVRLLLSHRGVALFANNHRSGNTVFYRTELEKHFRTVVQQSPPFDFPSLPDHPEHVRIYWCEV